MGNEVKKNGTSALLQMLCKQVTFKTTELSFAAAVHVEL